MEQVRQQLERLEKIEADIRKPDDHDAFWKRIYDESMAAPLKLESRKVPFPFAAAEVRDVSFAALDGTRIRAWLLLPEEARRGKVPCAVTYHGAGGNRGTPDGHSALLLAGVAVISMDFRMQSGLTASESCFSVGTGNVNWTSFNICDKETYYFRYVTEDALRCVKLARETPEIDARRICVWGGSQGGGMALRVAALDAGVGLCVAHVPSYCWLEHRVFTRSGGVSAVASFLQQNPDRYAEVENTLPYYDVLNCADAIKCPVLIGVGLKDPICPPEGIYAAYNRIKSEKRIVPYPFGEHGGGGSHFNRLALELLREKLCK